MREPIALFLFFGLSRAGKIHSRVMRMRSIQPEISDGASVVEFCVLFHLSFFYLFFIFFFCTDDDESAHCCDTDTAPVETGTLHTIVRSPLLRQVKTNSTRLQ